MVKLQIIIHQIKPFLAQDFYTVIPHLQCNGQNQQKFRFWRLNSTLKISGCQALVYVDTAGKDET